MAGDLMFTQSDRILSNRRKNLFVLAGMLPVFLVTVTLIWTATVGRLFFGLQSGDTAFVVPGMMAVQLVLLFTGMQRIRKRSLRLTCEIIEVSGLGVNRRLALQNLRKVRVRRGTDGAVTGLSLRFAGQFLSWHDRFLHLSGFHEMDVLRDMLIRYAGTGHSGNLKVRDPSAGGRKHD